MVNSGREGALKALAAYRRSGAWSDRYLSNLIEKEGLDRREAALAAAICYGVLQNRALLDFYLSCYSSVKLSKIEPMVLDILRLSAYQILFLSKVPGSAAVNEGVKLTKKAANPKAAGFVNAVLRKIAENTGQLPEIPQKDFDAYLAVKYSHPIELVRELLGRLDAQECEKVLAANNQQPAVTVQVNTLKTTAEELMQSLEKDKAEAAVHPWLPNCVEMRGAGAMENLEAFQNGGFFVQDAAARLAVMAAGIRPEMHVLDACAAPGGKSFAAALAMENQGRILSCDIHEKKLRLIQNGAQRLGISIIETEAADARLPVKSHCSWADAVIADVPCSGMGIIRKKPEIRYKNIENLAGLPEIQLAILKNLAEYVRPGGVLLYSTCTIRKCENEDVVSRFVELDNRFQPERFFLPGPIGEVKEGKITLYPHMYGTDGFFICKLRRKL